MKIMDVLSSESISSLFSCTITLYLLVLLYIPSYFSLTDTIFFIVSLVLSLLRLRAIREHRRNETTESCTSGEPEDCKKEEEHQEGFNLNPKYEYAFVERGMSAPLEVIYENSEGEEVEDGKNESVWDLNEKKPTWQLEWHPSLSLYYSGMDLDSSSDDEGDCILHIPESQRMSFIWEEEERELIEIHLDRQESYSYAEEDNLIEIDISCPTAVGLKA